MKLRYSAAVQTFFLRSLEDYGGLRFALKMVTGLKTNGNCSVKHITQTGNRNNSPSKSCPQYVGCSCKTTFTLKTNFLYFWLLLYFYKFHLNSGTIHRPVHASYMWKWQSANDQSNCKVFGATSPLWLVSSGKQQETISNHSPTRWGIHIILRPLCRLVWQGSSLRKSGWHVTRDP